ncbi:hypothetical protein F5Y13DRAFT_185048 [Hypoxylon sp. FL1857]|nr:hypothetical protein F5Y13DRAFT_185048 [Hypoxylon sp. FL1857]
MFTCRECLRKASTALIHRAVRLDNAFATIRPVYSSTQSHQRRKHTTTATYAEAETEAEAEEQDIAQDRSRRSRRLSPQEWAAQKQLQYLNDPLHIADYVRKTLAKGNFEEAALITRKASRDKKVIVSWNHLIDYQLQNDRLHAAIKLYNEMKKRAQLPNAQTFTIIFRGCATSSHPKLAVSEAIRIYNTLLHNTRIRPNVIHMNAVLQVCAKAEDLDSLFSIVKTANNNVRAPNNLTYTTILNAIRSQISKRQQGPAAETDITEIDYDKRQAVQRAKAVWEEVIAKWRAGSIIIDEELVCAMGRTLLMGTYHDADSVAELLEQTMMIPQDNKLPIPNTSKEGKSVKEIGAGMKPTASVSTRKITAPETPVVNHALPGNNSLSMILSALEKTGKTTQIQRYWDIFTKQHGVVPDADNWHHLLTALRRGKNSAKTVAYLRGMPAELVIPKNFRMAMYTCLRDNLNRSAFSNATEVLKIMLAKLKTPDPLTLRTYLRVAYANKRYIIEQSKGDNEIAMMAWGKQLAAALANIWKPYIIIARQYENDGPESNHKRELVALARKIIAASDRVIFGGMVSPEIEAQIKPRRNHLNRIVVRHFEQMGEIDPNFRQDEDVLEEDEDEEDEDVLEEREDKNGFYDDFANRFQQGQDRMKKTPTASFDNFANRFQQRQDRMKKTPTASFDNFANRSQREQRRIKGTRASSSF